MTWPYQLKPCQNIACDRQTSTGSLYCCEPCDTADRWKYDPDGYHTSDCGERHAERGPVSPWDRL